MFLSDHWTMQDFKLFLKCKCLCKTSNSTWRSLGLWRGKILWVPSARSFDRSVSQSVQQFFVLFFVVILDRFNQCQSIAYDNLLYNITAHLSRSSLRFLAFRIVIIILCNLPKNICVVVACLLCIIFLG